MTATPTSLPVPYRIETPRLVIRCWSPEDAAIYKRAQDESRTHRSGSVTWAPAGEQTLDDVIAKLRVFRSRFDSGADFIFGVFDRDGAQIGSTGLHRRYNLGGVEIGYWVHPAHTRKGIATEAAAALTRVAFEVFKERYVEIRCAHTNTASAGVPKKLGYAHEATLRSRIELPDGGVADSLIFTLHAAAYPTSPAAAVQVAAFDAANRRVLG